MKISEQQDIAYEQSLLNDRLKGNQTIIEAIPLWIPQREEQKRLQRLEYLNTLTLPQRREYLNSSVQQRNTVSACMNMTNEELSNIDPDMLLIYNIGDEDEYPFAFALNVLHADKHIVLNDDSNKIISIHLPILMNGEIYNYYVSNTDPQLNFELIYLMLFPAPIEPEPMVLPSPEKRQRTNPRDDNASIEEITKSRNEASETIKLLTFDKLAQLGIDFIDLNLLDDTINMYLLSGYTNTEISTKLIQNVLEEDLID
jgi:hypothetical protein